MSKKLVLNNFEIRYVINAFNKYDVVNLVPYLNDSRELCYIVFYKFDEIYFTQSVTFCQNTQMPREERLSEFLERADYNLSSAIRSIKSGIFNTSVKVKKADYHYIARMIYMRCKYNYIDFVKSKVIENTASLKSFNFLENEALDLLNKGFSSKEILIEFFERFGLIDDSVIKKIITL